MLVKFKKLSPDAITPIKAHPTDAGFDMTATYCDYHDELLTCYTGIAVEIPKGYVGLLFSRSSVYKVGDVLCNSVGVIDSDYRGEIIFKFYNVMSTGKKYNIGDRIGQLVIIPIPDIELVEVNELNNTERGANGFGSTGK